MAFHEYSHLPVWRLMIGGWPLVLICCPEEAEVRYKRYSINVMQILCLLKEHTLLLMYDYTKHFAIFFSPWWAAPSTWTSPLTTTTCTAGLVQGFSQGISFLSLIYIIFLQSQRLTNKNIPACLSYEKNPQHLQLLEHLQNIW